MQLTIISALWFGSWVKTRSHYRNSGQFKPEEGKPPKTKLCNNWKLEMNKMPKLLR